MPDERVAGSGNLNGAGEAEDPDSDGLGNAFAAIDAVLARSEAAIEEAKRPGRALILSIVAALAVVGIVASGVFVWVGGYLNPLFAAADAGCAGSERLAIVADTTIAPALTAIAKEFDAQRDAAMDQFYRGDHSWLATLDGAIRELEIPDQEVEELRARTEARLAEAEAALRTT